jgi:hypothetical protein
MGTGAPGDTSSAAAYMASISFLNGPAVAPTFVNSPYYPVWLPSPRTFRYGGKGPCGAPLPTPTASASS